VKERTAQSTHFHWCLQLFFINFHGLQPSLHRNFSVHVESVLQRVQAEERALESARSHGNTKEIVDIFLPECACFFQSHSSHFFTQHGHAGLADGAARSLPCDLCDAPVFNVHLHSKFIATGMVCFRMGDGCLLQIAFVLRSPVVSEDVLCVEVHVCGL